MSYLPSVTFFKCLHMINIKIVCLKEMTNMKDTMNKMKHTKDKAVGEVKIAVGKATKNESLELEGNIQASKAKIGMKVEQFKKDVSKTINDIVDKD